jgi:hypothetical protein
MISNKDWVVLNSVIVYIRVCPLQHTGGQWRTEGSWGFNPPPPPKFRSFDKAEPNSQFRGKHIRYNLIRIWVSLICKVSGTPD